MKNVIPRGSTMYIKNIYFSYVPEGFKYEVLSELKSKTIIEFVNESEYFRLRIEKNRWSGKVNTEDVTFEEINVNGKDIAYYEGETDKTLKWKEADKECILTGNCNKTILLKILEGIKLEANLSPQELK